MNPHQARLHYLFEQYFNETAKEEEIDELTLLLEDPSNRDFVFKLFAEKWEGFKMEGPANYSSEKIDAAWEQITASSPSGGKVIEIGSHRKFRWVGWAAAAIILIIAGVLTITLNDKQNSITPRAASRTTPSDIAPGHDGAILTLADGRTIVLDNARDGKITEIAVKNGNKVSYEHSASTKVEYNTMTTPKGRQFSLVLPDGTEVWLNAASSITYPTAFIGKERKVTITGEAYFEVAHDASKPFHVGMSGVDVQVLGTHFNINSYPDEGQIKTTLLEGSVKITKEGNAFLLKPGQQAQVTQAIKITNNVDIEAVMAWKNGYFSFSNADIQTIMRQIARWYDVEVVYQGEIPDRTLDGRIPRNVSVSNVLAALQYSGIKFKIEGNQIIVAP